MQAVVDRRWCDCAYFTAMKGAVTNILKCLLDDLTPATARMINIAEEVQRAHRVFAEDEHRVDEFVV